MELVVGFEPYVVRVKGGCPGPLDDTSVQTWLAEQGSNLPYQRFITAHHGLG